MISQTATLPVQDFSGNSAINADNASTQSLEDLSYKIINTNWYQSLPYGFSLFNINSKTGDKTPYTIYLPISPSNITITTSFATNIITTLYGIVEEHSEVRYYDITIQGTTGFSPRFVNPFGSDADVSSDEIPSNVSELNPGRKSFPFSGDGLDGFLSEITNTVSAASNLLSSIASPGGQDNPTGIDADKSGYVAFHNLYRSFLKYKNDAAQVPSASSSSLVSSLFSSTQVTPTVRQRHPIQFLNYKDNVKYDCVPLSFTMVRSADNPMLYNYIIKLKAFNLRTASENVAALDELAALGLGGLDGQSLFSTFTSIASNAATLISAL